MPRPPFPSFLLMTPRQTSWASAACPVGTCYRVLLWEAAALPAESLAAWREARAQLLSRMRDAGVKGARGLLRQLEEELRCLTHSAVAEPLATCPRAALSLARVSALEAALQAESGVLAYRLTPCCATVLVELVGEASLPTLLERWAAATPEIVWCAEPAMEALPAAEAHAWQLACQQDALAVAQTEEATVEDAPAAPAFHHVTVLAQEAVDALLPAPGKVVVDATLGGGGHSELLLRAGAEVWGIDQDPAARRAARQRLAGFGERLHILAGNFRDAARLLHGQGVTQVDGLLADIGVSSPQVDCAERGFSFLANGPLDMRMNPQAPRTAADIVNTASEEELADILWQYGEERASRAIARRIVQERAQVPFTTTAQLADCIASVLPRKGRLHPATRSFQALRIAVNDELGALEALLESGLSLLNSGGRFAVITFHSLEDRAVKRFFERVTREEIDRPEWPAPRPNPDYAARLVFRKPLTAGEAELAANPRARSAKLRVIEKI